MFSNSKSKPLASLAAGSSRKKFLADVNADLCNRSFDTAQALLNKNWDRFKQTKLGIRKRNNEESWKENQSSASKKTMTTELFLMPLEVNGNQCQGVQNRQANYNEVSSGILTTISSNPEDTTTQTLNPMALYGRDQIVLTGKVDYCLKMNRRYPDINALWDVYGTLVKITVGKNRFESTLLLRTAPGVGPVLQSIFYDVNNVLSEYTAEDCLHVVGKFIGENRLKTFKVEKMSCKEYNESFTRIANVISYCILHSNMKKN